MPGMEKELSGLNHTSWRAQESRAGRWTSPDPYSGSMRPTNPQSFNRYSYVGNDPVNLIDPSGLDAIPDCGTGTEPTLEELEIERRFGASIDEIEGMRDDLWEVLEHHGETARQPKPSQRAPTIATTVMKFRSMKT